MRDEWIAQHLGAETEPRPGFEDELAELLTDEWNGVARPRLDIQGGRPVSRRKNIRAFAWIGAAAAVILAVIVVVKTRDTSDSHPVTTEPTLVTAPDTSVPPTDSTVAPSTVPESTTDTTPDTTPSSEPSSPTTVPDTVPATTTVPTLPAGEVGFAPACEEVAPRTDASTVQLDEPDLAVFGPLDVQPAISFDLPVSVGPSASVTNGSVPSNQPSSASVADVARVPGGFLFTIRSNSFDAFPGTILRLVDDDGGTRWQRCLADATAYSSRVAPPTVDPTTALVFLNVTAAGGGGSRDLRLVDLATGDIQTELADRLTAQGVLAAATDLAAFDLVDDTPTHLLFVPTARLAVGDPEVEMLSIDLSTMQATPYPLPPGLTIDPSAIPSFGLQVDGTPFLLGQEVVGPTNIGFSAARWQDGAWVNGRQPLPVIPDDPYGRPVSAGGITVQYTPLDAQTSTLQGIGPDGTVVWTREDLQRFGGEGFDVGVIVDTVLAVGCTTSLDPTTFECPSPVLAGLDARDGHTLWQKDGFFSANSLADGYALVTGGTESTTDDAGTPPTGWSLLDVGTGELVDGQHWDDPATFAQECCGGDDEVRVDQFGGVLVTHNGRAIRIYYPLGSAA